MPDCLKTYFGVMLVRTVVLFLVIIIRPYTACAVDCATCHGDLAKKKVVHAAVQMGCESCHSGIDASSVPHKKTTKAARGLSAEIPDLCYGCHDKAKFAKKTVHPALGMGCTSCHNPHSSDIPKLLKSEPPGLCFNCHDKSGFTKKNVHPPVAGGMCTSCHNPHASDNKSLLMNSVNNVCATCHDKKEIRNGLHIIRGFGGVKGHPVSGEKDPARPDSEFSCASCHNPHSSDWMKLFRYNAASKFDLCQYCHKI